MIHFNFGELTLKSCLNDDEIDNDDSLFQVNITLEILFISI